MHTTFVVTAGLVLLGACIGVARVLGGAGSTGLGAIAFLPLWLTAAGINMYAGVRRGHSAFEEIPFFLLVFAIPAAAAFLVWLNTCQRLDH
jgi:hypothetical protein